MSKTVIRVPAISGPPRRSPMTEFIVAVPVPQRSTPILWARSSRGEDEAPDRCRALGGRGCVFVTPATRSGLARKPGHPVNKLPPPGVFLVDPLFQECLRARTRRIPPRCHRGHHPRRRPAQAQHQPPEPELPPPALPAVRPQ